MKSPPQKLNTMVVIMREKPLLHNKGFIIEISITTDSGPKCL
jgi:hypothetical protein